MIEQCVRWDVAMNDFSIGLVTRPIGEFESTVDSLVGDYYWTHHKNADRIITKLRAMADEIEQEEVGNCAEGPSSSSVS